MRIENVANSGQMPRNKFILFAQKPLFITLLFDESLIEASYLVILKTMKISLFVLHSVWGKSIFYLKFSDCLSFIIRRTFSNIVSKTLTGNQSFQCIALLGAVLFAF